MTIKKNNTHGGKRPNSGRKKGEKTKTISFRIVAIHENDLKIILKKNIKEFYAKYGI